MDSSHQVATKQVKLVCIKGLKCHSHDQKTVSVWQRVPKAVSDDDLSANYKAMGGLRTLQIFGWITSSHISVQNFSFKPLDPFVPIVPASDVLRTKLSLCELRSKGTQGVWRPCAFFWICRGILGKETKQTFMVLSDICIQVTILLGPLGSKGYQN